MNKITDQNTMAYNMDGSEFRDSVRSTNIKYVIIVISIWSELPEGEFEIRIVSGQGMPDLTDGFVSNL